MLLQDTMQNHDKSNCVNSVKQLLERLCFVTYGSTKVFRNTDIFLYELKDRLKHDFVRIGKSEIDSSTRVRT